MFLPLRKPNSSRHEDPSNGKEVSTKDEENAYGVLVRDLKTALPSLM